MDWKDVGKLVAPIAPIAGSILGGFLPVPGGSIIGQKFGELIASAFGVAPTPQAVSDAIANASRDEVIAKITAATEQARIQVDGFVELEKATIAAIVQNMADVNRTMQSETAGRVQLGLQGLKEHWFFTAGRPASLWVFNFVSLCFGMMLTAATAKVAWVATDPLKVLSDAWPLFASYFGPLCLVNGIYINGRSAEKKASIENATPMPNAGPAVPRPPVPLPKPSPIRPAAIGDPPGSRA